MKLSRATCRNQLVKHSPVQKKDFHSATQLGENPVKILTCIWGCPIHLSTVIFWCEQKSTQNQINQKMCIDRHTQLHTNNCSQCSYTAAVTQLMLHHVVHLNNDTFQVPGGIVTLQTALIYDNSGHQHSSLPPQLSP